MLTRSRSVLLVVAIAMAFSAAGLAAQGQVDEATKEKVKQAIEAYVQQDITMKGKFLLLDPRGGGPLALNYDHIHAGVDPHTDGYVACVDFTDNLGLVYDVDVVVQRGSELRVSEFILHKVDGKEVEK